MGRPTAARPDLHALRMRSRVREAESLLDPSGLGGFLVSSGGVDETQHKNEEYVHTTHVTFRDDHLP